MRGGRGIGLAAAAVAGGMAAASAVRSLSRAGYRFNGRTIVVTGGSRGLGLLMAREAAGEGARVALLARDEGELERAVRDVAEHGGDALGIAVDVRQRGQVDQAIERVIERFGGVDVLINNAGTIQVGPIEHMTMEDFEEEMAIHFWAPLYTMRAVIPHMRLRGQGRIVNIASIGGRIGVPHLVPYCASKFALVGLSESMRAELKKHNILITTVNPWLMRTGSYRNVMLKGRHEEELTWFGVFDSLPVISMDARRAARKILNACRRGQAEYTVGLPAKLAVLVHAVMPGLMAANMALMNRLLPNPEPQRGWEAHRGWETSSRWAPSMLTRLSDEAAQRNNEIPRKIAID